ncbi:hypothetical protein J2T09_002571 [Neorhizobium huautlense]|uniref:Transposase n=1 Tax=Neorhizobium huautlense TaxID=67774 RepID=A0ABT9PVC8_9HYPH|nr:hypothetical protein [Neorhizobium huautlense]
MRFLPKANNSLIAKTFPETETQCFGRSLVSVKRRYEIGVSGTVLDVEHPAIASRPVQ